MFVPLEQLSAGIQYKYLISGDYLILPVSLTFIAAFTGLIFYSDFGGFFKSNVLSYRTILNKNVNAILDVFVIPLNFL